MSYNGRSGRSGGRSGGGRGRGDYYKNKYGGGRSSSRGGGGRTSNSHRPRDNTGPGGGTYTALQELLGRLDGQSYGAYHALDTPLTSSPPQQPGGGGGWHHADEGFRVFVERAQSDPYAAPTRCRIVVETTAAGFPNTTLRYLKNPIRCMALSDYLLRTLSRACKACGADTGHGGGGGGGRGGGGNWNGAKGGEIHILEPSQHVLEQSAVRVDPHTGTITVQLAINLPARGRSILGREAATLFGETVPQLLRTAVYYRNLHSPQRLLEHLDLIEDQLWLQQQLEARQIIGFLKNGAILPRFSGNDDRPMRTTGTRTTTTATAPTTPPVIPFVSPKRYELEFTLPNAKTTIVGMGIPMGITLICGGGFHGKSTLLSTIQLGIYPKIAGDGREYCMTSPSAIKIRAEDGRSITHVDISNFITNLPFQNDTQTFSSRDASGSTSQAAAIVEALECGATTLLVDEDTCATNFMIRDEKMMQLVESDKEPITPFVRLVRSLYEQYQVSSVLVIGGTGDYFDVADHVLVMDSYQCLDATEKAKRIVANFSAAAAAGEKGAASSSLSTHGNKFQPLQGLRTINGPAFVPNGKVKTVRQDQISYNDTDLDLKCLEQLVTKAQTMAIASALQMLPDLVVSMNRNNSSKNNRSPSIVDILAEIEKRINNEGLDCLTPGQCHGQMARPRSFELAGAINRLRRDKSIIKN